MVFLGGGWVYLEDNMHISCNNMEVNRLYRDKRPLL